MIRLVKIGMVLLSGFLSTMGLAACSGGASGPDDDATGNDKKPAAQVELTVSAAASLTDALRDIQPLFEAANPDIRLRFNFGGSGALQRQIEQGAPADLFLSAASKNMQTLLDKHLIDPDRQTNLLMNELVAIVPEDSEAALAGPVDFARGDFRHIAIGTPESVPAGGYAKEALVHAEVWDALQPKLVLAKDVRQVLQYVETGNADAGFVYKTDALTSRKIRIAFAVDPATYAQAVYPIGVVKETKHPEAAAKLYDYLRSGAALAIFEKYGFTAFAGES